MASDSSSVLELNDADATDTEAPSVTDDAQEGAPLIMEHGYDIAVKVDAPMKQLSTLETYVTYRVRCVCARWATPPYVRRRFNHFKLLHKRLSACHPLVAAPPLPPLHSARQQLDRYSATFVAVRALALNLFLDRVAKHPILTHSEDFRLFLTTPDEDLDKVFKSENSALNLWGLSSALYSGGDSKPTNGARVKDPEFSAAAEYLQSLQQKLTTLCLLTTKLYKGSVSLSSELMGLRRACDAWSAGAGGRVSLGAAAAGAGGAAAAAARARPPLRHRAALPLLAAYARAHYDKIRARDHLHASYVSGNNTTDELHNRLEQASEALRSELSDWLPKTRADIKAILLELADRQVNIHTQTLIGWENALKMSTEDVSQMFKTVSKSAVQNLSPSRQLTPNTDRDIDDFDDNDSDDIIIQNSNSIHDDRLHESNNENDSSINERIHSSVDRISNSTDDKNRIPVPNDVHGSNDSIHGSNNRIHESNDTHISNDRIQESNISEERIRDCNPHDDSGLPDDNVVDENTDKEISKDEISKISKISDPLSDFFEVDLS